MQRDAIRVPQEKPFRPADNSLFNRHLTHTNLLCFSYFIFSAFYSDPSAPCMISLK